MAAPRSAQQPAYRRGRALAFRHERACAGARPQVGARVAAANRPELSVVGSAAHGALCRAVAERSITLVRNADGVLPLRLGPTDRILAVMPRPEDLTPADT